MNKDLVVSKTIKINTGAETIWQVLTLPEKIKLFLYGTNTSTDWKVGSTIKFEGEYQGNIYKDKGNVLKNIENKELQYNYWSTMSGTEDKLDNYSIITYSINQLDETSSEFTWTQKGFGSEAGYEHTENTLFSMLEKIKELAEAEL